MVILFYVIIIVVVLCICYHVMVKWTLCKTDSHSISDDWYIIIWACVIFWTNSNQGSQRVSMTTMISIPKY